jgi:hypothetical protein
MEMGGTGVGDDPLTIQRPDIRLPIADKPIQVVFPLKGPADKDGDGFTEKDGDCNDSDPRVFPGQTKFFDKPYELDGGGKSFDYDCDGKNEKEAEMTGACLGAASPEGEVCVCSPGWTTDAVPECGDDGEWSTTTTCGPTTSIKKTQGCR